MKFKNHSYSKTKSKKAALLEGERSQGELIKEITINLSITQLI